VNKGQSELAESEFLAALGFSPDYQQAKEGLSHIYHNRGIEKGKNGDIDGCISLLERALSYYKHPITQKELASAYALKGVQLLKGGYSNNYKVLEYLKKANELDPSNDDIRQSYMIVLKNVRGW
jgi:tetratricopeptide (TPR) repeat protein